MPQGQPGAPPSAASAAVRPRTAIAWVVIVLMVAAILVVHGMGRADAESSGEFGNAVTLQQVLVHYGIRDFAERFVGDAGVLEFDTTLVQLEAAAGGGPVPRRQRFAVVAGDLRGREEALRVLDETERLLT